MAQFHARMPFRGYAGAVLLLAAAALLDPTPCAARDAAAPRKPLDLRAPDIRRIVPAAALREPLPADGDDVTIESRRNPPPDPAKQPVPGGLAAPAWAVRHPTQAWRIFAPDPNSRAADRPDPVPTRRP